MAAYQPKFALDRGVDPWLRQKKEGAKAYAAFCLFRDAGPERSLRDVARQFGRTFGMIYKWSSWNKWADRVLAYENHLQKAQQKQAEKARVDMMARHANEAMLMQQKALEKLRMLQAEEISVGDVARLIDVAVKVERLARGESTENVKEEHSGEVKIVRLPTKAKSVEEWNAIVAEEVGSDG